MPHEVADEVEGLRPLLLRRRPGGLVREIPSPEHPEVPWTVFRPPVPRPVPTRLEDGTEGVVRGARPGTGRAR